MLEVLYTRRRTEPSLSGVSMWDLESLIGRAREQLEFTVWYLTAKKYVTRSDSAELVITAEGVEFLEANYAMNSQRRLTQGRESLVARHHQHGEPRLGKAVGAPAAIAVAAALHAGCPHPLALTPGICPGCGVMS